MNAASGIVIAGIATIALAVPTWVNENALLASPCTYKINQCALEALHESSAHCIQFLHYFGKPIDRLIQALVVPIFFQIEYFINVVNSFKDKHYLWATLKILIIPLAIPINLSLGLFQSAFLLVNGAVQLILPIQTIYAIIKGREAAREYFDYRLTKIEELREGKKVYLPFLAENERLLNEKPNLTLEKIDKQEVKARKKGDANKKAYLKFLISKLIVCNSYFREVIVG